MVNGYSDYGTCVHSFLLHLANEHPHIKTGKNIIAPPSLVSDNYQFVLGTISVSCCLDQLPYLRGSDGGVVFSSFVVPPGMTIRLAREIWHKVSAGPGAGPVLFASKHLEWNRDKEGNKHDCGETCGFSWPASYFRLQVLGDAIRLRFHFSPGFSVRLCLKCVQPQCPSVLFRAELQAFIRRMCSLYAQFESLSPTSKRGAGF